MELNAVEAGCGFTLVVLRVGPNDAATGSPRIVTGWNALLQTANSPQKQVWRAGILLAMGLKQWQANTVRRWSLSLVPATSGTVRRTAYIWCLQSPGICSRH